jgi:CubicO group peptidase (beta-lactamase class C family)
MINKFMKIQVYLLTGCMLLTISIVDAQTKQVERPDGIKISTITIDSTIQRLMHTAGITGLQLGIVNHNQPVYLKSYGYKNKTTSALNDTATCFYGASLSKSLFAFLVMQLVDSGIIQLDKPLYGYLPKPLPEYENYTDLAGDERWKLITARHCLDHTTGFPNWRQFNPRRKNKLEIFFTPGDRYAYSGEGLWLLQFVTEVITGRSLEDMAQEKIFRPFGMTRTSYIWQPHFETDFAVGHTTRETTYPKNKRKSANAAGSLETTIGDYTRFMAAVMRGDNISQTAKNEMLSPQVMIHSKHQFPSLRNKRTQKNKKIQLAYGLGWGLFTTTAGKAFFKEGHGDGWQNYTISFPEKQIALVILANSDNAESIFTELVEILTGITIPWEWEGYIPYRRKD